MDTGRIKEIETEVEDTCYFYFLSPFNAEDFYGLPKPDGHAIVLKTGRVSRAFPYRVMPDYKAYGKVTASDVEFISKMLLQIKGFKKAGPGHAAPSIQEIEEIIGVPLPSIGDNVKVAEDVINKITAIVAKDDTRVIDLNKSGLFSADPCCTSNFIMVCRGSSFMYRSWHKN